MKFWQKAFFLTLALFLIAFNVLGHILLQSSYSRHKDYALLTAQTEHQTIEQSVFGRIAHLSPLHTELNQHNLRAMIAPYANYYTGQGIYLALLLDGVEVFNSNPYFSPHPAQGKEAFFFEDGDRLTIIVGHELLPPFENLRLVYMRDTSSLLEYRTDMIRVFVRVSVAIGMILAIVLLFMLVRLTRPFRRLNEAALSIAGGDYDNRAPVRGNDEVGQFARSFNLMADKVQDHVDTLTRMSESKELFINDLAHEIKTPITAIMGYAELLNIGNISEGERTKAIDYITTQSRRIQGMTSKLSDLALMSHGNIEKESVDIARIIENALASCNAILGGKHIILTKEIGDVNITGDEILLESLIQNLVENAAKYTDDGGEVEIRAYTENDENVLAISDSGKGIEESKLAKITEPFYRVDGSRSRVDGGVGLGLALCARICEAHGARLEIVSKPGEGTRISIYFTTL